MNENCKTCSLHYTYHTGCIDCQHDMTEEISILRADNEQLKAENARMREMVRRIDDYAEEAIIDSYKRTEKQAHHDLRRFAQSTRQRCEHALKGGE